MMQGEIDRLELPGRQGSTCAIGSRRDVVERAEAYLRSHLGTPVPCSELCRIVGLSERGLRSAFYRVRGMSPKQYMLANNLLHARHALCTAPAGSATVTRVATTYGFYELGRFAATYREAFGEAPSETLRRRSDGRSTALKRGARSCSDKVVP
jgi:transcriptional regulator GlxA family with amidase domain